MWPSDRLLAESLPLQQKLHRREGIAWALAGVAEVSAARRELTRAATLWATAQAVCDDVGVPFMPGMRRRQERAITAARTLLGENEFAAAWSEGYMMLQDKAIAYALEGMQPAGVAA